MSKKSRYRWSLVRSLVGVFYNGQYFKDKREWLRFIRNQNRKIKKHMEGTSQFKAVREMEFERLEVLLNDLLP